ncbi:MAG: carbohydrate porin [Limnobacter sp.]|nr:carbohydrate porin [Limnobacter sp.]
MTPNQSKWVFAGITTVVLAATIPLKAFATEQPTDDENAVEFTGSWLVVGQKAKGVPLAPGEKTREYNTRLDLEFEKPIKAINGRAYAHIRAGAGSGLQLGLPTFTGSVNTTAFAKEDEHLHDAKAIIAQAWVEIGLSKSHALSVIVGKIDPTVFFDHNEIAHDESEKFINNILVHNPLLDTGGDYGIDENGFSPGVLFNYQTSREDQPNWMFNLGFFGAGNGPKLDTSPSNPFTMAQVRYFGDLCKDLPGSIATYYWSNPKAENALTGQEESHTGWGISLDQNISKDLSLFARTSQGLDGTRLFDRALTYGTELKGSTWNRPQDHIALGVAHLRPDPVLVLNGEGNKRETTAELMYAYAVNERLVVSADFQWIKNSAGDSQAPTAKIMGLRSKLSF